eukprot:g6412.t1
MLTDFLLILLRELLPMRPDLRLILMSATLDVSLGWLSESLFPVEEIHLEDAFFSDFAFTNALLNAEKQSRQANEDGEGEGPEMEKCLDMMDSAIGSIVDELSRRPDQDRGAGDAGDETGKRTRNNTERESAHHWSKRSTSTSRRWLGGSVLCFLPGWNEIRQIEERLAEGSRASAIWAVPLHSTLPKERQQQVFRRPPRGKVKVILGTNIAESSVTIGDVEVVIDSGLKLGSKQRELTYDPKRRISSLDTVWVSQSGAVQRRGRAGRVRAGRVLRLYSREQFDALPLQPSPEMQRCDLAQSCLQTVALGRHPRSFLANAIDPPDVAAVEMAMEQLVLARLPLEPLLGRAALLGCILGLPEHSAALLVAAGGRTPFLGSRSELSDAQGAFCLWSDPLAAAKAVLAYEKLAAKNLQQANQWAAEKNLSASRLANLSKDKSFLLRDMKRAGLLRGLQANGSGAARSSEPRGLGGPEGAELLETRGELEEALLEVEQEEETEDGSLSMDEPLEGDLEALLATVLCSAYPGNIAMRSQENRRWDGGRNFNLSSHATANMSPASVNFNSHETHPWWLYCDVASSQRTYMHSSTLIHDWQIALFGGLRFKEAYDQKKHTCMTLDNWLQVGGLHRRTNELILKLRAQVRHCIAWKALDALEGPEKLKEVSEESGTFAPGSSGIWG